MDNLEILDGLIIGRVEPSIYAFSTNTVPNYLKVGDTYRSVAVRLNEWKRCYPDLEKEFESTASVTDKVFFRDYSVHEFLENALDKHRLSPEEIDESVRYSREFFRETGPCDVEEAIADIVESFKHNQGKYRFYNAETTLPVTYTYASTGTWKPRPNQQEVIDNFRRAVAKGRNKLLMYAVMRFGKSFTSLCCAKEIAAKTVLVVSAKADVRSEWQKTVQGADNFNRDYAFITAEDMANDSKAIESAIRDKGGVVVFLTLQDLQGTKIKERHESLFEIEIDLLIVDETHFGARAESYGYVLRSASMEKDVVNEYDSADGNDCVDGVGVLEAIKSLRVGIQLHLSGTPYRVLMGSEFSKEDIVCFCQFADIVAAQEEWDEEHLNDDDYDEWDNPYYGFPQMIRFGFTPSKKANQLLERYRASGVQHALSELMKPCSIKRDSDNRHLQFIHAEEVLELVQAIDGSTQDEGVFPFLDYSRIKDGKMCQHIVCVLPYCASCDAMEELLSKNKARFKNLASYEVLNISGLESAKRFKTVQSVKTSIKQAEEEGRKTITLTVNRMLTGSTVEQWDTMIYLKDTSSPQEYDQAIFRLQNQHVAVYLDEGGREAKVNLKPQTLLVDFDPCRMLVMQEQKSQIYNVNTDLAGNRHLEERLREELRVSPIITLEGSKMKRVEPKDIMKLVSEYSSNRGVLSEAQEIPIDRNLFEIKDILEEIQRQAEIGTRGGLRVEAHEGEEYDLDEDTGFGSAGKESGKDDSACKSTHRDEESDESLEKKLKTYYSRILFYSFLTTSEVGSLGDVLDSLNDGINERILDNLGLSKHVLRLIQESINPFVLSQLDYKIQNLNLLSRDNGKPPIERAITAMDKFGRLSDSEVTTPLGVAREMMDLIPDSAFVSLCESKNRMLDVAGKMGEFAIAAFERCVRLGIDVKDIQGSIETIPTSSIAYEFTSKVYEYLGLSQEAIAARLNSYDLIQALGDEERIAENCLVEHLIKRDTICDLSFKDRSDQQQGAGMVHFNAIVGNPPYQEGDGGAGASARALYPAFVDMARTMQPDYISMIIPSKWFTGGKNLKAFRSSMLNDPHIAELHDCVHPEEVFPGTNNRGGVCFFLWDNSYDNGDSLVRVVTHGAGGDRRVAHRPLKTGGLELFIRDGGAFGILEKVWAQHGEEDRMSNHISAAKAFGYRTYFVHDDKFRPSAEGLLHPVICYGRHGRVGYVEYSEVLSHPEWINCYKVFIPESNNIGTELNDDNQNAFVGKPDTVCTESLLVVGADLNLDENTANNLCVYLKSKFSRFLLSLLKVSQHGTREFYRFVPVQDFSICWDDKKLYAKYKLVDEEIAYIESSIKPM